MGLSSLYFSGLSKFCIRSFAACERLGFYVIHRSFYGPIPESKHLTDRLWARPSEMIGVDLRTDAQRALARELGDAMQDEYAAIANDPSGDPRQYHYRNPLFGPVDAHVAYGLVRTRRPRRLIEIGSGNSSRLLAAAVTRNAAEGHPCRYAAIDPYPSDYVAAGLPGLTDLVRRPVQDVPLAEFAMLGEGDVLFIDSSHQMKVGSDVHYQFLEILPRLAPGVLVHFHDIFLPHEYDRDWVLNRRRFWNEQYVLQAFLTFNRAFEVLWAGYHMMQAHRDEVLRAFPQARADDRPGSFWIRRTG